jgi:hypothetical protein
LSIRSSGELFPSKLINKTDVVLTTLGNEGANEISSELYYSSGFIFIVDFALIFNFFLRFRGGSFGLAFS